MHERIKTAILLFIFRNLLQIITIPMSDSLDRTIFLLRFSIWN